MRRFLAALIALMLAPTVWASFDSVPSHPTNLGGHWRINTTLSDDAEQLLAQRLDKERAEERRWRQRTQAMSPPGPDTSLQLPPPSEERRRRRNDRLRQMLGMTEYVDIVQSENGTKVDIATEFDSRRFSAGTHSQISMPEGELADSDVGWDGEWFVIERRVKGGPRVTEKYRILPKTGQLESIISWGGDTILSGIKVRRVFDRAEAARPAPDATVGPSP